MTSFRKQRIFLIIFVNILFIKWISSRRLAFLKNQYGFDPDVSEINLTREDFILTIGIQIKEDITKMFYHADVTIYPFGPKGHPLQLVNYTGNFCNLASDAEKQYIIKEIYDSFNKTTNMSISCPVPAGYYVVTNFHFETGNMLFPKSLPDINYFADISLQCQNKFGDMRSVIWTKTWGKIIE